MRGSRRKVLKTTCPSAKWRANQLALIKRADPNSERFPLMPCREKYFTHPKKPMIFKITILKRFPRVGGNKRVSRINGEKSQCCGLLKMELPEHAQGS
jgi:hypothetical protein